MLWFVVAAIVVLLGLAWCFRDAILEFWKKQTKIWKASLISIILLTASLLGGSYFLGGGGDRDSNRTANHALNVVLNSPTNQSSVDSPVSFVYTPTSEFSYEKAELFFKTTAELSGNLTTFSEAGITGIAYGDVNNDGENEYVFGTSAYNSGDDPELVVYKADTDTKTVVKTYSSTREIVEIKIVDFDHDGDNDVLYGTSLPARQCFLELNSTFEQENYGDAQPTTTTQVSKMWGHDDWDNDGVDEVICTYCGTGNTYIVDGNYSAGFSMSKIDDSGYNESGEGVTCYDVYSDGKKEAFVVYGFNTPPKTVKVQIDFLEISTSLTVSSKKTVVTETSYSYSSFGGRIGDLDGNGIEEFTVVWCETDRDAHIMQCEFDSKGDIVDNYVVADALDCVTDAQRGTSMWDYDDDGDDELLVCRVDSSGVLSLLVYEVDPSRNVNYETLFTRSNYGTDDCFGNIDVFEKLNGTVAIGVCDYGSPASETTLVAVNYRADFWLPKKQNQTSILNSTANTIQYSFNWSDLELHLPLNFSWNVRVTDTFGNTFASSNFTLQIGIDETTRPK